MIEKYKCKEILREAHRHFGSIIGSKQFVKIMFYLWSSNGVKKSLITKTHLQAVCSASTSGYKHRFTFFMRTIENNENFMLPLDKVIKQKLIPALFIDFQISETPRRLIALPWRYGHHQCYRNCERRIRKLPQINQEIDKPYYTIRTQLHSIRGWNKKNKIKNTEEADGKTTENSQFIAW